MSDDDPVTTDPPDLGMSYPLPEREQDPWYRGLEDYGTGASNPYPPGSPNHSLWQKGWDHAEWDSNRA